jgi:hypothetical protein
LICLNGKTCMIENGMEVCRCLFNCSSEKNQVKKIFFFGKFSFCLKICASNGVLYRNLCEMERDRCIRGENFVQVDNTYCRLFYFI